MKRIKLSQVLGALPVGLRGKFYGLPFKVLIQYELDGSVVAQIYNEDTGKLITNVTGRKNDLKLEIQRLYVDVASLQGAPEKLILKDTTTLIKQLSGEVKDYNEGKTGTKKAGRIEVKAPKEPKAKKESRKGSVIKYLDPKGKKDKTYQIERKASGQFKKVTQIAGLYIINDPDGKQYLKSTTQLKEFASTLLHYEGLDTGESTDNLKIKDIIKFLKENGYKVKKTGLSGMKKKLTKYFSKLHKVWKPIKATDNVKELKKYKYKLAGNKSECMHVLCGKCGGIVSGIAFAGIMDVCSPKCANATRDMCSCKCGGQFHKGQNWTKLKKRAGISGIKSFKVISK